jgi:hypothetical protein
MNSTAFSLLANNNSKVDGNRDRRFSTSSTNPHSSLRKFGSGDGPDDWKSELSRRFFGFDSPLGFNEIGSIGRKNCENHNDRIIDRLFQQGKLAGQLCNNGKKEKRKSKNSTNSWETST